MNQVMALSISSPVEDLNDYIRAANKVPMLAANDEINFATRLRDEDDLESAQQLILPHLRLVIKIARSYNGYGLALGDLIQEGNIGLMKAVKRFDVDFGVRLSSFASHWIKAEIHEFILKNWRIVKVATTKAQRKLFFNLRKAKKQLGWFRQKEVDSLAEKLDVKPTTVREMESRLSGNDIAFDGPQTADDSDSIDFAPSGYIYDEQTSVEAEFEQADTESNRRDQLSQALESLDERSRQILFDRWLTENKKTLKELALEYQVSAERIRQIESSAMKKVKAKLLTFQEAC